MKSRGARRTILVVNDDGVHAPGLEPLARTLRPLGRVVVVVPQQERSAASHAITLHKPIRLQEIRRDWFITNGSPSDCVRIGILWVLRERVDLVVSGVNHGANLGADTMYSGTVGAAKEACLLGVPSIAVSLATHRPGADFSPAARVARRAARRLLAGGLPPEICLNINVPDRLERRPLEIRPTRLGRRLYGRTMRSRVDPRGKAYYWMAGALPRGVVERGTDVAAVRDGCVSVTPLRLYLTDERFLGAMKEGDWVF